jgi:hypothetical protein
MSPDTVHAYPLPPEERDGWIRLAARVEGLPGQPDTLWFDLEARHRDKIPDVADSFLLGLLFPAMEAHRALHVHGDVSHMLLRNMEHFQAMWSSFVPDRYSPIEMFADREVHPEPGDGPALLAFSGGLDSAYTARRHALGVLGRRTKNIEAGLMILGFDISRDRADYFDAAAEGSRAMLSSLGYDLWKLSTNFRDFKAHWFYAHGTGLAAALHCYAGGCSAAILAASNYHRGMRSIRPASRTGPAGSHALTDRYFSSPLMEMIHDGSETGRSAKTRLISEWPEGMAHLRVCWETPTPDSNCGVCSKCLLTKLAFMANGLLVPGSLTPAPTATQAATLRLEKSYHIRFARHLLELAAENGVAEDSVWSGLRSAVRRRQLRTLLSGLGLRI